MDLEKDVKYRLVPTPKTYESLSDRQSVALLSKDLKRIATTVNNDLIARANQTQTGTMSFSMLGLVNPVYDDSQQSAMVLRDTGVNVPGLTQIGTTGIYLPKFAVNDVVVFCIQMPHSLAQEQNVTIHPHVHWIGSTTSPNVVKWQMTYQWLNNESDTVGTTSSVTTCQEEATANMIKLTSFPEVTKESAHISSIFAGNLKRITNGGSEYAGDVFLAFFDIHHRKDSMGSDDEGFKTFPRY